MPDLARQGPFSYDVLSRTGNGEYTLDKSDFNADNGEILEVIVNGVKIEGDGSVANATDAGNKSPAHGFFVDSLTNPTKITLVSNPGSGTIKIYRLSNRSSASVDFAPGSVIREQDLDNSTSQTLHVAQEAIDIALNGVVLATDDKWDANSKVIKSVADGSADNDAVNKGQLTVHDTTITGYRDTTNDYKLEAKDWAQLITSQVKAYSGGSVTGSFIDDSAKNWASGTTSAAPSAGSAKEWAIGGEGTVGTAVAGGEYSAKKHAQDASTSAGEALASKTAAAASEAAANASADAVSSIIDNFYDKYLGAMADNATQGTNPTPTGEWAKDSSTITVSANTNIKVGQVVTGHSSIPAGANVLSIDGTAIVISANMTAASPETDPTLTFTGYGVYGTFNGTKDGPATDNDGDALADGMLYFNTTDDVMMVYDTTSSKWKQLQPTTSEMTAIQTCHTNISTINDFAEKYRIAGSAPGSDNDEGDLYYNTTDNKLRYYDGSSWTAFGLTEAQTQTEANNASVAMSIALG
tara:strand:+ start:19940 stop:21511 length:1572 start_codon:yes stop_codon:yes gene_type:complete